MNETHNVNNVRKTLEFDEFIKMIEDKQIHTWVMCARALNVRPATITEWKRHPIARKAIIKGIHEALENMQRTGKDDWRMWREKLKLLGVDRDNVSNKETEEQDNLIEVVFKRSEVDSPNK